MIKRITNIRDFGGFRELLQVEGVTACLAHLGEHELDEAVKELHSMRAGTAELAEKYRVVAFHLGDVTIVPLKHQLTHSELERLDKVLHADAPATWLTRVCCGHFANALRAGLAQPRDELLPVKPILLQDQMLRLENSNDQVSTSLSAVAMTA